MHRSVLHQILTLAGRLEPDREAVLEWIWQTHISVLDGHTAMELVLSGHGQKVVTLLQVALEDEVNESRFCL
jgi:hypothetical protein